MNTEDDRAIKITSNDIIVGKIVKMYSGEKSERIHTEILYATADRCSFFLHKKTSGKKQIWSNELMSWRNVKNGEIDTIISFSKSKALKWLRQHHFFSEMARNFLLTSAPVENISTVEMIARYKSFFTEEILYRTMNKDFYVESIKMPLSPEYKVLKNEKEVIKWLKRTGNDTSYNIKKVTERKG